MKILIVCNNAYTRGNGLCTAVLKHVEQLEKRGVEARIMASRNPDPDGPQPYYCLKHFNFLIFEGIIYSNGFRFATTDRKVIRQALEWADVVHLEEGFPLEITTASMAAKLGKPCVGTYHLYSENIMANLGMYNDRFFNRIVTQWWRRRVYDRCKIVQCPSENVRRHLVECGFSSEMRVISNGILNTSEPKPSSPSTNPLVILCTGRLSNEKSQVTLLEAMKYSRHAREIQLIFAGKGPKQKKYMRIASGLMKKGVLALEPQFGFFTQDELSEIASKAYLYIHCAWVEVEGLSCLEAIRCGAVPVIAEGPLVATSQFALDDRSKFPVRNASVLAEKIDWWIEHPEERQRMSGLYAESVSRYDIELSTDAIIRMYEDAMVK